MIALDTNVLVRFLTQDDPDQGRMASGLTGGLTEQNPVSWREKCLWNSPHSKDKLMRCARVALWDAAVDTKRVNPLISKQDYCILRFTKRRRALSRLCKFLMFWPVVSP